ncbi:hypothetical protein EB118_06735, partial [bacterium]|nr:hypothetical protein [bacterium]
MTFASKALESATERFFLVRLTSRRYLAAGQLSAGKYIFDVPSGLNIENVTINGEIISSSDWIYSGSQIAITSALNLTSLSNVVTLDHNIFLTGTKARYTSGVSGISDATWEPLIVNYPRFSQSMRNIAEGVFSLSNTSISFICTDRWGQSLIGKPEFSTGQYESLSNAPVAVWACIDSVENNRKIFDGAVSDVGYANGVLDVNIIDTFQKLNNTSSFGTRAQSYIYTGNGTMYPRPEDENKAIPICLGKYTPYKIASGYRHIDTFDWAGNITMPLYHMSDAINATRVRPDRVDQTSTTEWIAGRVVGDIRRLTFGSVIGQALVVPTTRKILGKVQAYIFGQVGGPVEDATYNATSYIVFYELSNINNFNGEIGDFIPASALPATLQSLGAKGAAVSNFGPNLYTRSGKTYNIAFYVIFNYQSIFEDLKLIFSQAAILPADNTFPAFSCFVEGDNRGDYEFEATELAIGITDIKPKLNFFTNYVFPTEITLGSGYIFGGQNISTLFFKLGPNDYTNISESTVKVRYGCQNPLSHGNALKFVLNSAGMET